MNRQTHWQKVYSTKAPSEMSWFRPHLDTSFALIEKIAPDRWLAITDVGGGESTMVDDLVAAGYRDITVLDISQAAIEHTKTRLGAAAQNVTWMCEDLLTASLPTGHYAIWHDRAVFHFLTERAERVAYVRQVISALRPGGHVVVSAFGPEGPQKCSGLDVRRYDAESFQDELGDHFRLVESCQELHRTPFGTAQPFVYCHFVLV
jgi:SAM-dependent methyltransferase